MRNRLLKLLSGLFWTLTYILIIKRGFEDQTFGMPMIALCANISWEFIFAFVHPHGGSQRLVNTTWFLFDVIIFIQFVRFGYLDSLPQSFFYPVLVLVLIMAFGIILFMTYEFDDWKGKYSAFGQNLLMSILFITMLLNRGDLGGQSIYIAIFKLLGSLTALILIYFYYPPTKSKLIGFLGVNILFFDLVYVVMVYQKSADLGLNVWTLF